MVSSNWANRAHLKDNDSARHRALFSGEVGPNLGLGRVRMTPNDTLDSCIYYLFIYLCNFSQATPVGDSILCDFLSFYRLPQLSRKPKGQSQFAFRSSLMSGLSVTFFWGVGNGSKESKFIEHLMIF